MAHNGSGGAKGGGPGPGAKGGDTARKPFGSFRAAKPRKKKSTLGDPIFPAPIPSVLFDDPLEEEARRRKKKRGPGGGFSVGLFPAPAATVLG